MSERPLSRMRVDYGDEPFDEEHVAPTPLEQFHRWLDDAVAAELPEPNAMVLATTDGQEPSGRTVLLKDADSRGLTFFTNRGSRKGADLAAVPRACLVFPWIALSRQVIVRGLVVEVPREESAAYFASRPRSAQLGAWASRQSSVLAGRAALEEAYAEAERRFPGDVPLPDHWGGFLVMPTSVEFWRGRASRLHDRLRFDRGGSDPTLPLGAGLADPSLWSLHRLSP